MSTDWIFPISNNQLHKILGGFPRNSRNAIAGTRYQTWDEFGIYAEIKSGFSDEITDITFQLRRPFDHVGKTVPKKLFGGTLKFNGKTVDKGLNENNWIDLKFSEWTTSRLVLDPETKDSPTGRRYIRKPEVSWANPVFRSSGDVERISYKNRTRYQLDNDPIDCSDWEIDYYRDHILLNGIRLDFPVRQKDLTRIFGKPRSPSNYLIWDQHGCFAKGKKAFW